VILRTVVLVIVALSLFGYQYAHRPCLDWNVTFTAHAPYDFVFTCADGLF